MARHTTLVFLFVLWQAPLSIAACRAGAEGLRFEVTVSESAHSGPLTGRLIVMVATRESPEPRRTVGPLGPTLAGVDVSDWHPGQTAVVDSHADCYPEATLADLPAGTYYVQAILHRYTHVRRADGHALWVPFNDGTRTSFPVAPGNLYSAVERVDIETQGPNTVALVLHQVIPPSPPPSDTEWVKHVCIQSQLLTEFWGHPTFINATVLLPRGYADDVDVRYPTIFTLVHSTPFSFNTDPRSARGRTGPHPVTGVESGYEFYQSWIEDDFPRVIAVSFQQQTPFFPDSYSVNSANCGPYGDAITQEVIPHLEGQFRMLAQPSGRILEGASTGGWQALALQLKYPEYFGGAWVLQPDPIDFTRYGLVNIYEDDNAFTVAAGDRKVVERPMRRTVEGQAVWTMRDLSRFEAVLGTRGRSGFQLMGWEAVYGPVGDDGYPRPLWDKQTGVIDRDVAESMRQNGFDLTEFARRHWPELRPHLQNKLHFYCGDMDDFYLNLAVYRFEEFIASAEGGDEVATFTYGRPTKGHSWHAMTWAEFVRAVAAHVQRNATQRRGANARD